MKRTIMFILAVVVPPICYGCASVTAVAVNTDGTRVTSSVDGIRYYLPKPYLLVAEVPAEPKEGAARRPAGTRAPAAAAKKAGEEEEETDQSNSTAAPPSNNTSFLLATAQYAIKLIYLPDYSKPMALQAQAGLFGSTTFKPNLQDGWMLTSFESVADNTKVADVLTAVGALINPASSVAAEAAEVAEKNLAAKNLMPAPPVPPRPPVLAPGLYEIMFDKNSGAPTGIRAVGLFCGDGLHSTSTPTPTQAVACQTAKANPMDTAKK